jgi:hypothetical protein
MITKDELKTFIEEYVSEYRRLVEESYKDQKSLFPLSNYYPIRIIAYFSPTANLWEYIPNTPKFEVQVEEVGELPKPDRKNKHYIYGFRNDYLLKIVKEAKKVAREDVNRIISENENYEEYQKELSEYYDRQYIEYAAGHIEDTVKGYSSYIASAYEVKTETISKYESEIYDVVLIIESIRADLAETLLTSSCKASFEVIEEVAQDMESSLFLAMHGKYVPANALLRRILENTLTALYFDDEVRKCKVGSRTHQNECKKRDDWVKKSSKGALSFTTEYGVLGKLIDPDTDYAAKKALEKTNSTPQKTFGEYVRKMYGELCKFVHYGGLGLVDRVSFIFAQFDEKKFEEWVSRFKQVLEVYTLIVAVKFPDVLKDYEKRMGEIEPVEQVHLLTHEQEKILIEPS